MSAAARRGAGGGAAARSPARSRSPHPRPRRRRRRYLPTSDAQLQRLRRFAHSAVAWFRAPFAQLVLVSAEEVEDYKRSLRPLLRAMVDAEPRTPAWPELLFVYIRPRDADPAARGPAKVLEAMRKDLGSKRRERVVRLDPPPPGGGPASRTSLAGLPELEAALTEAIRASFEARAAAYEEEVRRLMAARLDPAWPFPSLFLVKDSLAVMMEAAGEDERGRAGAGGQGAGDWAAGPGGMIGSLRAGARSAGVSGRVAAWRR